MGEDTQRPQLFNSTSGESSKGFFQLTTMNGTDCTIQVIKTIYILHHPHSLAHDSHTH